jgi:hypothetical protein
MNLEYKVNYYKKRNYNKKNNLRMSIFQDFARRELADQYNSSIFTLLHCLSIRVAMAVK